MSTVTIDFTPLTSMIEALANVPSQIDWSDVLISTYDDLRQSADDRWQGEVDPSGEPWQPLAEATVKKKGHDIILIETDRLRQSLASRSEDSIIELVANGNGQAGISFGTAVEYSHWHMSGTTRMPARPFLGWEEDNLKHLTQRVADTVAVAVNHALNGTQGG